MKKREPNTAINHAIIFPVLVGASPTALPVVSDGKSIRAQKGKEKFNILREIIG